MDLLGQGGLGTRLPRGSGHSSCPASARSPFLSRHLRVRRSCISEANPSNGISVSFRILFFKIVLLSLIYLSILPAYVSFSVPTDVDIPPNNKKWVCIPWNAVKDPFLGWPFPWQPPQEVSISPLDFGSNHITDFLTSICAPSFYSPCINTFKHTWIKILHRAPIVFKIKAKLLTLLQACPRGGPGCLHCSLTCSVSPCLSASVTPVRFTARTYRVLCATEACVRCSVPCRPLLRALLVAPTPQLKLTEPCFFTSRHLTQNIIDDLVNLFSFCLLH